MSTVLYMVDIAFLFSKDARWYLDIPLNQLLPQTGRLESAASRGVSKLARLAYKPHALPHPNALTQRSNDSVLGSTAIVLYWPASRKRLIRATGLSQREKIFFLILPPLNFLWFKLQHANKWTSLSRGLWCWSWKLKYRVAGCFPIKNPDERQHSGVPSMGWGATAWPI